MRDKILLKTDSNTKFGKFFYKGFYNIVCENNNGIIIYQKSILRDIINIRTFSKNNYTIIMEDYTLCPVIINGYINVILIL